MKHIGSILGILTLVITASADTNTAPTRALSLNDCIQLALSRNFDIQIEQGNSQIAEWTLKAYVGAYNPVLFASDTQRGQNYNTASAASTNNQSGSHQNQFSSGLRGQLPFNGMSYEADSAFTRNSSSPSYFTLNHDYTADNSITVRQPLLKNRATDDTRRQIQLAEKSVDIAKQSVRGKIIETITGTEQAYYDLIYAQENVGVQVQALELAQRLLDENRKRISFGAMSGLDEKQALSQLETSRADLISAQGAYETQQNVLKNLLTDEYLKWHNVAVQTTTALDAQPKDLNLDTSWKTGQQQRPDILQQQLVVEQTLITTRFTENQRMPSLDLFGTYGYTDSDGTFHRAFSSLGDEDSAYYAVGLELQFPLGNTTARNQYLISRRQTDQATLRLNQLRQLALVQIDDAVKQVRTTFQRVGATRQAVIYADAALTAEVQKLQHGATTGYVVLQLQRDLTNARTAAIRSLADYNKTLSQLAFHDGTTLERHNIKLEIK